MKMDIEDLVSLGLKGRCCFWLNKGNAVFVIRILW